MSPEPARALRGGQYLRVSRDVSGRARSVDEQQTENERDAATQGAAMVRTYRDPDRSASRFATRAREEYATLLQDIAADALDILWLWEPSRGSRRVSEWVELIELAEAHRVVIRVTSHDRTYDPRKSRDRKSLLEAAVDAEFASGEGSERVNRAFLASADAGEPGGRPAYGYRRVYDLHSGRLLHQVPDAATAAIVAEVTARLLQGDTLRALAADLNRRGIPTPQMVTDARMGKETAGAARLWDPVKVRRVVSTPTVAGWRVHRGLRHAPAAWEPIVSAADHAALIALLDDPSRVQHRGTAPKYLVSGIAECGECGAWLRHFRHPSGLSSYACGGQRKGHVVRRRDMVDALATVALLARLGDPELLAEIGRRKAGDHSALATALAEVEHVQAQIRDYQAQAVATGMPAEMFAPVIAGLSARLVSARTAVATSGSVPAVVVALAGPDAQERWDSPLVQGDIVLQRQAVRALLRVVVGRSSLPRGSRAFDASTVVITSR